MLLRRAIAASSCAGQSNTEQLLPGHQQWSIGRHTYSSTGLEILVCVLIKGDQTMQCD